MAFKSAVLLTVLLAFVMVPVLGYPPIATADKLALYKIREAVVHKKYFPPIACGNSSIGPQSVSYIGCDSKGRVTDIYCNFVPWGGVISPYIGNLTNLVNFTIYFCGVGGKVPSDIGRLSNLRYLSLENNQFKGTIPSAITNLKQLKTLSLALNAFTGVLPANVGNMAKLKQASFSSNQLRGGVPASIKNLTLLESFYINKNYFTGPIFTQNGHPGCFEAQKNCLFSTKFPCKGKHQKTQTECDDFFKNNPPRK